jgi:LysM repeat protein
MNRQRSPLRALAPLSLVAFAVALLLIVNNADIGGADNGSTKSSTTNTTTQQRTEERTTTRETTTEELESKYKVKAGDTLAAIAERTGTTVERLLELNPNLDPNAMRAGQEICLQPSSDCGS